MRLFFVYLALVLGSLACEGSAGPMGPQGEQGERGEQGEKGIQGPQGLSPLAEVIFVERRFSRSLYDGDYITITDDRISPETFLGLYFKYPLDDGVMVYRPVEYPSKCSATKA